MPYAVRGAATVLLLCYAVSAYAGSEFRGALLSDALRTLQRSGLHIVFTSEIVTHEMRVTNEPHSRTPREQLDELLAPHGLEAVRGPGQIILVVRRHPAPHQAGPQVSRAKPATDAGAPDASVPAIGYTDSVTVLGAPDDNGTSTTLGTSVLARSYDATDSEGLRAVRSMPRVVATDDSHIDFSVRGSPYRQIGVVIDGVATRWLQHAIYGRNDIGSVSMFGSDALESATLRVGAYPQRYDDNLGAQLELTLREGSRRSTRLSGSVGGQTAGFSGEGPIGWNGRGSWIAGFRNSYRPWPPGRQSQEDNRFEFADVHGKMVYDLSSTQQISITALGGRSTLDELDEPLITPSSRGTDQAALVSVAWRWTAGPGTVIRQQLFGVGQEQSSTAREELLSADNHNRAIGYRMQILRRLLGGTVDAGTAATRTSVEANVAPMQPDGSFAGVNSEYLTDAAYIDFARTVGTVSFEVGGRVSHSTLIDRPTSTPWFLASWHVNPAWTLDMSAGGSRQFPEVETDGATKLEPERATHLDIGVAETLPLGLRWQATLFRRDERDVLRLLETHPPVAGDLTLEPPSGSMVTNVLSGRSEGVEFIVSSAQLKRFSGWTSYTWSRTRQANPITNESFWSDEDRRHTLSATGMYRLGQQADISAVLHAASGIPIPGSFVLRGGQLFIGNRRNEVRLPTYARVDVRAKRTFLSSRHALTAYGDILNVLNRPNEGIAPGSVTPVTGEAVGFSRVLQRRSVALGIEINLWR